MSDYETKKGTLQRLQITPIELFEDYVSNGGTTPKYYNMPDDIIEFINEELDEEYLIINNKVYKILEQKDLFDDDIYEIIQTSEDTFDYLLKYYNGGCSFYNAIESAFEIKGL